MIYMMCTPISNKFTVVSTLPPAVTANGLRSAQQYGPCKLRTLYDSNKTTLNVEVQARALNTFSFTF
jgi:hypothetical protein